MVKKSFASETPFNNRKCILFSDFNKNALEHFFKVSNLIKIDSQCSSLKMKKGTTFKPHKHIWKEPEGRVITQESWVVLRGSVKCYFYDVDDTLLATPILKEGDASFTFYGGHTYEILEDDTIVYEYKTGPYLGQKFDKVFLKKKYE